MKSTLFKNALAATAALVSAAAFAGPIQTLTFGGTLGYGSNYAGGPFGASNANLGGKTYSVTLSYDSSLFKTASSNSCIPSTSTSCQIKISVAAPVTETITVNGTTKTYIATGGVFDFNGGGTDSFDFNLSGASGLSISGYFQDTTKFFPKQNDLSVPIFSNFTNLNLTTGSFNEAASLFSLGANPTSLTAALVTVPEPMSAALFGVGLIGGGLLRRRRGRPAWRRSHVESPMQQSASRFEATPRSPRP